MTSRRIPLDPPVPGRLHDRCSRCWREIRVHDLGWRSMRSAWGRALAANYCSGGCRKKALRDHERTAERVAQRQEALAV